MDQKQTDNQISESIKLGQEKRTKLARHIKELCLGVLSAGLLVLDWWLFRTTLLGGVTAGFWIWPAVVTGLWIVFVSFFALVNPDKWAFFTFNAIGLVAYLFLMPRDIYIFIGGAVFFLLSLWFQVRIQDEEKNQLNFSIRRTLGNSQVLITYGILIMLGFLIYANVRDDFKRDPDAFYHQLAQSVVRSIPYLSGDSSKYNLNQSVDEYFRRQAESQYPEFNSVSKDQQEIYLEQVRNSFSQQFGVQANGNQSLLTAMTEIITQRMREVLGRYERFFPLLFTLIVVAVFRTFAIVFNWAVLLVSWILYRILLSLRFFRLVKTHVEVEHLDL